MQKCTSQLYISAAWPAGLFIVVTAELAHGPGMTTLLLRAGPYLMNGGLHLLDPHTHIHHPRRAELELCKQQRISWAAHTAWLMLPRVDGSLGWWCSSSTVSSSLPLRLPTTLHCSRLWASTLCWLWGGRGEQLCTSFSSCWSTDDCCAPKDARARAATCLGIRWISFLFFFFFFPHA